MCRTFYKHFGLPFIATSYLSRKIPYHENRTFLFCLSIYFKTCTVHNVERIALILEIKNTTPNITLNKSGRETQEIARIMQCRLQTMLLHVCKAVILYITNARLAPLGNSIETEWYKMATESVFHSEMMNSYCF